MISIEHVEAATPAAPPVAPAPATPAAPPATAPTGQSAVKAAQQAKQGALRDRMKVATAQAIAMVEGTAPATPAPTPEATAADGEPDAPVETPNDITWDASAGRYRDPATGNFVAAPEGASPPASDAAPSQAPAEDVPAEPPAEDATPAIQITLPNPRGGEDMTVEVDDPEAAELVNTYKNGYMRREELNRRLESVQQKESSFREFEATLQHSPESLVDALSPENRTRFRNYLLAVDFDQIRPQIEAWYQDENSRRGAIVEAREQALRSRAMLEQTLAAQRQERAIFAALDRLIPDHATPADADDFRSAAVARLSAIASQGGDVRPETVALHLERDIRRFGFLPPAESAPGTTPSLVPTTSPAPRAQKAPAPADVAGRATATQQRFAAVATQRQAAAPIVPTGTGAVPATQMPRPASFKDATKRLSQIPVDAWKRANSA